MVTERIVPEKVLPPWIRVEHHKRYEFGAKFCQDKTVVDCACGSGEGTKIYANAGAYHVSAFDISDSAIQMTKDRCAGLPVTACEASATNLPCQNNSADVFISFETIEHLTEQDAFLAEITRILKPGGLLILSTPNRTIYSPGRARGDRSWNPYHLQELTTIELLEKVSSRFDSVSLFGQNRNQPFSYIINFLAKFSPLIAVRFRQALKLRWLLKHDTSSHDIQPAKPTDNFEITVVICRMAT